MAKSTSKPPSAPASSEIDRQIAELGDWRGERLAQVRRLIRQAVPDVKEAVKWRGVPVWEHGGILCTGEVYANKVKLTFARGAVLPDPAGLFNASLDGKARRAIDLGEGDELNRDAFLALIQAAAAENRAPQALRPGPDGVVRLSGGNPQIPKGDGDAPVQAYIAAMPGWQREVGERLDSLIEREVPGVQKCVRWNSPFYGVEGRGWFLSVHVLTKCVKATFFNGVELEPPPPGFTAKSGDARWIDVREGEFDEAEMGHWVRQAAALPGWEFGS
jgi:hypothetical protein